MRWADSVLLGCLGGLVGVTIWAVLVFRSGRHLGWFVFVIGVLVGLGVRWGVDGRMRSEHGGLGGVLAIGFILLGKYAAAHLMAARLRLADRTDDEFMISAIADRIVERTLARGESIDWPPEKEQIGIPFRWRYPAAIWDEAEGRWTRMSPSERRAEVKQYKQDSAELLNGAISNMRRICFSSSFNMLHLIWIAVGALGAFGIASGSIAW